MSCWLVKEEMMGISKPLSAMKGTGSLTMVGTSDLCRVFGMENEAGGEVGAPSPGLRACRVYEERGERLERAGPALPLLIMGQGRATLPINSS